MPTLATPHSLWNMPPLAFCRDSSGPTLRGSVEGICRTVFRAKSLGTSELLCSGTNFRNSKDSKGLGPETSHWPAGSQRDGVQEHPSPQAPGGPVTVICHTLAGIMGSGTVACCRLQRSSHPVGAWIEGGKAEGLKPGGEGGGVAGLPCTIHGGSQPQQATVHGTVMANTETSGRGWESMGS